MNKFGLKHFLTKILLITLTIAFLFSCNAVKRVPEKKYLLDSNQIFVDSTKSKDPKLYSQLYQKTKYQTTRNPY